MARRNGVTEEEAIANEAFLFRRLRDNPELQEYLQASTIPTFITDNLAKDKKLRPYQEEAVKTFIWLYENDRKRAKHLLFNMATGTGKTLVMACCILYLYTKGYRNFVFTVSRENIIQQAKKNFTDYKFDKYLFNSRNGIHINGRRVNVNALNNPTNGNADDINICFVIINTLHRRLCEPCENQLSLDDFINNKIVIIADEAHHLNASTKSRSKQDVMDAQTWEDVVRGAVNARPDNMLLEFTATVDLKDDNVRSKYCNKLLYRYNFAEFNHDGYSKDVQFLYNQETQIEDQKKLLIVNAVALSEFRRLLAERTMHTQIKPIVLVKSTKIAQSEADREFFDNVISSLRVDDLRWLRDAANRNQSEGHRYEIIEDMFRWVNRELKHGWDSDSGLAEFVNQIKMSFAHDNAIIYNSRKKEHPELIMQLDNPRNNIRAVFSVNALNEGWDVLSLYDIIHFDISESKKVSMADIQLIGRGARYCPYALPSNYKSDQTGQLGMFGMRQPGDKYRRKFDDDPLETGRALETMVYHFVKTGAFMENLIKDLQGEGIIRDKAEARTIRLKPKFEASETFRRGVVLVNYMTRRYRTTAEEIDTTFNQPIIAAPYKLESAGLSDREQNQHEASQLSRHIRITEEFFSRQIIEKALVQAEDNFFRFGNLRKHIPDIRSIDDLINYYLPKYDIQYFCVPGKDIDEISADEKRLLLVNKILHEVRRKIDLNMPQEVGSRQFKPVPLADVFMRQKTIYLVAVPVEDGGGKKTYISQDEQGKAQSDNDNPELQYDIRNAEWYAYDENYGTTEEKRMVKWLAGQMPELHKRYPGSEIYLIRNELDYFIISPKSGQRFSPDYLLIINDVRNHEMYYQVIIEPKGSHIIAKDEWKEQFLLDLNDPGKKFAAGWSSISNDIMVKEPTLRGWSDGNNSSYQIVKPIGLPFYNSEDAGQRAKFTQSFRQNLLD